MKTEASYKTTERFLLSCSYQGLGNFRFYEACMALLCTFVGHRGAERKKRFSPKQCRQTVQIDLTTAVNVLSCLLTSFYSHTRFKCHLPAGHL